MKVEEEEENIYTSQEEELHDEENKDLKVEEQINDNEATSVENEIFEDDSPSVAEPEIHLDCVPEEETEMENKDSQNLNEEDALETIKVDETVAGDSENVDNDVLVENLEPIAQIVNEEEKNEQPLSIRDK